MTHQHTEELSLHILGYCIRLTSLSLVHFAMCDESYIFFKLSVQVWDDVAVSYNRCIDCLLNPFFSASLLRPIYSHTPAVNMGSSALKLECFATHFRSERISLPREIAWRSYFRTSRQSVFQIRQLKSIFFYISPLARTPGASPGASLYGFVLGRWELNISHIALVVD